MNTEREYKGLITEAEYKKLIKKYDPYAFETEQVYRPQKPDKSESDLSTKDLFRSSHHINRYFDTNDFDLFHNGCSLRIRDAKDGFTMTLKSKNISSKAFLSDRDEYNKEISGEQHREYLKAGIEAAQLWGILKGVAGGKQLRHMGTLWTTRHRIKFSDNLFLEMDKSYYEGITDYEIEFEYEDEKELNMLHDYLNSNGIYPRCGSGKFSRFIEKLHS